MAYKTDLSVNIAGVRFNNPVMPASGTYAYFDDNANLFPMSELGAVMIKSVHRHPRGGNPAPRICEVSSGMINAVGIPSEGIESFIENDLQKYESIGTKIVLSLAASQSHEYAESLEILNDDPRIAAVELNLSCPNVGSGLPFSSDAELLSKTVAQARKKTKLPMIVKITPIVTDMRLSVRAAEDAGADALTLSNTYRAMKIDIEKQRPFLGNTSGGMSGPAVKPMNLFNVWQSFGQVHIPIIASGGISCWQDAVEYMLAGASMVQVGCANFVNPMCMPEVIGGIDEYLYSHGFKSASDIVGLAHGAH